MNRRNMFFVTKCSAIYIAAYLVAGGIAYQLLTKQFYVGDDPIFTAYLRSESNSSEWAHVNAWLLPGLLIRALLISIVLLQFTDELRARRFWSRYGVLFATTFVLTHIAAASPSPGNIEGLIYIKPEISSIRSFALVQPEMLLQCSLFALGLSLVFRSIGKSANRQ